jgi:hypothetical protein
MGNIEMPAQGKQAIKLPMGNYEFGELLQAQHPTRPPAAAKQPGGGAPPPQGTAGGQLRRTLGGPVAGAADSAPSR